MDNLPANVTFVTNDTEHSITFQTDNGHTDLAVLVPAGDDPAHFLIADYLDGYDEPLSQRKLYKEEIELARMLLNSPRSLQILGIS